MGSRNRDENAEADVLDFGSSGGFLRAIPGGAPASSAQTQTALLLLSVLVLLFLLRRGFRGGLGAGHLHIGGADAVVTLLYLLAWTAILRKFLEWASVRLPKDTASAVAYFVP